MVRMLVMGLDGASFDLIKLWRRNLPNLSKLMEEGAYGELESTMPPITCPAWISFATGKNPGKLGLYDFQVIDFVSKRTQIVNSTHYKATVWDLLSQIGTKVCIFNFPATFPPRELNGCVVSGFLSPPSKDYTNPPALAKEIEDLVGEYKIYPDTNPYFTGEDEYLHDIEKVFNKQVKVTKYLMKKNEWGLFLAVFMVLDWVQHYFWHFMDKRHPLYNENNEGTGKFGNVIKEWYMKLDTVVGDLINIAPKDTYVLILSDHGFGPLYGRFFINTWLLDNGFLAIEQTFSARIRHILAETAEKKFVMGLVSRAGVMKKSGMGMRIARKGIMNRTLPRELRVDDPFTSTISGIPIDWNKTRAIGFGYANQIYILSKKRRGPVSESEINKIRKEIADKLMKITRAENFKVTFKIYNKEEIYFGEHVDSAPDMVYVINNGEFTQSNRFNKGGIWEIPTKKAADHRPHGVWILKGPHVKKNFLREARIIDLAPTIIYIFQTRIPLEMDGKMISDVFEKEFLHLNMVQTRKKVSRSFKEKFPSYSDQEIKERLRALGYTF